MSSAFSCPLYVPEWINVFRYIQLKKVFSFWGKKVGIYREGIKKFIQSIKCLQYLDETSEREHKTCARIKLIFSCNAC